MKHAEFYHPWRRVMSGIGPLVLAVLLGGCASAPQESKVVRPIRALLVTGGCCHDYPFQTRALTEAISTQAAVNWTVVNEGGSGTRAEIALYDDPLWARDYDIVVHNECFADTADEAYIRRITRAHLAGTPAVVIHCAMHTYRAATIDDWRQFLGVTSRRHDHQSRYKVRPAVPDHPIMKNFPSTWTTPMDELYVIEKIWPKTQVLAVSQSERDQSVHPVFWTNEYGNARVFGTTYGHTNEAFQDPVFLETLTRGFLWASGRLD